MPITCGARGCEFRNLRRRSHIWLIRLLGAVGTDQNSPARKSNEEAECRMELMVNEG